MTSLSETLGTPAAGDCRRSGFLVLCASRAPSSNSNYSFYCCCVSPLSSTIHGGRPFCTIGNGQQLGLPLPCFGLQQLDVNARSSPSIVEDRATRCLAAPRECLPLDVPRSKTTADSSIIIARIAISNARISAGLQSSNSARNVAWRIFEVAIFCLFYSFSPVSLAVAIGGKCLSPPPKHLTHMPLSFVTRKDIRYAEPILSSIG